MVAIVAEIYVFFVFCFFNVFAMVVCEIYGFVIFMFFQCFCFGSGLGALARFGDLSGALGCSGRLRDALGALRGSGRLCEALGSSGRLWATGAPQTTNTPIWLQKSSFERLLKSITNAIEKVSFQVTSWLEWPMHHKHIDLASEIRF